MVNGQDLVYVCLFLRELVSTTSTLLTSWYCPSHLWNTSWSVCPSVCLSVCLSVSQSPCLSALPHMQRKFNVDYQLSRRTLGRYGLASHGHTIKMRDLSGGQKARVVFAELSLMDPDVLIMVSVVASSRLLGLCS